MDREGAGEDRNRGEGGWMDGWIVSRGLNWENKKKKRRKEEAQSGEEKAKTHETTDEYIHFNGKLG